jgi:hypothetical protein
LLRSHVKTSASIGVDATTFARYTSLRSG